MPEKTKKSSTWVQTVLQILLKQKLKCHRDNRFSYLLLFWNMLCTCPKKLIAASVRCCWDTNRWQFCDGSSGTPEAGLLLADPILWHSVHLKRVLKRIVINHFLMPWINISKYNEIFTSYYIHIPWLMSKLSKQWTQSLLSHHIWLDPAHPIFTHINLLCNSDICSDRKFTHVRGVLIKHDKSTVHYLQRQGVLQRDREADSPLAGRDPWSLHSYPLWHQTVSVCGHTILG